MACGQNQTTQTPAEKIVPATKIVESVQQNTKYQDFSAEKLTALSGKKAVLFFHANWCSWCRARDKEIMTKMDMLPENTVIFKANFDAEEDLRAQYEVKTKDTFVFLKEDGTFESKAGASVDTIIQFFSEGTVSAAEDKTEGQAAYMDYDPAVVATFIGKKPYAFDFYADWCPSCRATEKEILENIDTLPAGAVVFKVDYDSNKDLRDQYGVKSQHTIVFFDKDGNAQDVVQGFDLDDIIAYFSK